MKKYIYFEDLSASEKKTLRGIAFRKEKKLTWMNAFSTFFAIFVSSIISNGAVPQSSDSVGRLIASAILGAVLGAGFSFIFYLALIEPRVIRIIERLKNEEEA